jgi:hypothetical protein
MLSLSSLFFAKGVKESVKDGMLLVDTSKWYKFEHYVFFFSKINVILSCDRFYSTLVKTWAKPRDSFDC